MNQTLIRKLKSIEKNQVQIVKAIKELSKQHIILQADIKKLTRCLL